MAEKSGPGLTYEPTAEALTGFGSLMPPPPPKKPSLLTRLVKLPFKIIALPFKIIGRILSWPFRLLGGRSDDDATDT